MKILNISEFFQVTNTDSEQDTPEGGRNEPGGRAGSTLNIQLLNYTARNIQGKKKTTKQNKTNP